MLLSLYRAATIVGGPLVGAHLRRRARRGKEDPARLGERLGLAGGARPKGPLVWLHGASVGESLAMLPLVEALLEDRPGLQALITTGTVTSARLLADRLPARARHQFVPVDRPQAWRRFLAHWRPDLALIVESELWPNLILETAAAGVPMALINARMSPRSFRRWRRFPVLAARLLRPFEICLAQSGGDALRFAELGARNVHAAGNLKHAAPPLPADPKALADLGSMLGNRPVWLAASTHPGEEEQVLEAHGRMAPALAGLLTVIAPRHPERGDGLAALIESRGLALARRSKAQPVGPECAVYLADTMGELGLLYRIAKVALIGGSLVPHGGQNPLEAARLGCPPVFGPYTANFDEITAALEAKDAAIRVADVEGLASAVARLLRDPDARAALAARARAAAESEREVLPAMLRLLMPLLERALGREHATA
jgi:3-deoxy-D-manno-octulosonic-acid transferase